MEERLVYDIGMHTGQDTAYYLHQGCRVVAVEANPILAEQGAKRFKKEMDLGLLHIENAGVSDQGTLAPFWICDEKSEWSSFDVSVASRRGYKHHAISIPVTTLPDLFQKHGKPYFVKLGVKGSVEACLRQIATSEKPSYISAECSGFQTIQGLAELGYRQFKVVDQICFCSLEFPPTLEYSAYWGLKKYCQASLHCREAVFSRISGKLGGRKLAEMMLNRYQRHRGYCFEEGSSGPWGEDAPGRWKTQREAEAALKKFDEWRQANGEAVEKRWFDVHAKA